MTTLYMIVYVLVGLSVGYVTVFESYAERPDAFIALGIGLLTAAFWPLAIVARLIVAACYWFAHHVEQRSKP